MLNITFFGVRGSTPCSSDRTRRYGGNTSCVAVESPGQDPVILDMGTGLRYFGETQPLDGTFNGTALVTHLHWDHVQGLPFFVPAAEGRPPRRSRRRRRTTASACSSPSTSAFGRRSSRSRWTRCSARSSSTSAAKRRSWSATRKVTARSVPHVGPTNGYRIEWEGATVAYISDHQQPSDGGCRSPTGPSSSVTAPTS